MKFYKIKRRFLTLIEVMIVITIIGLLMGALAYNFTGSLDKGRALKTRVAIERVTTILNMYVNDHPDFTNNVESQWKEVVKNSSLVSDPGSLLVDGWGQEFHVTVDNGEIYVYSDKYNEYTRLH